MKLKSAWVFMLIFCNNINITALFAIVHCKLQYGGLFWSNMSDRCFDRPVVSPLKIVLVL